MRFIASSNGRKEKHRRKDKTSTCNVGHNHAALHSAHLVNNHQSGNTGSASDDRNSCGRSVTGRDPDQNVCKKPNSNNRGRHNSNTTGNSLDNLGNPNAIQNGQNSSILMVPTFTILPLMVFSGTPTYLTQRHATNRTKGRIHGSLSERV